MSPHSIWAFSTKLASRLGEGCTKNHAAKSFGRSAGTQLAGTGAPIVGSCEAGD